MPQEQYEESSGAPDEGEWAQALIKTFGHDDEGNLKVSIRDPREAVATLELLAIALITFYEEWGIFPPNLKFQLEQIRNKAGDALEFLTDMGDHG